MNYPPKHHQETNFENIVDTITTFPLATVLSAKDSKIWSTHLPLAYKKTPQGYGKLVGHIDKYNPQADLLQGNKPCTVIFHGPQSYISPSLLTSKQLPTWNYIKVHIEGKVKRIDDAEIVKASIVSMTNQLEGKDQAYILNKDDSRMAQLIDYIVGFEIEITSWEGKFKLSQDKSLEDQNIAKSQLKRMSTDYHYQYIEDIYKAHRL